MKVKIGLVVMVVLLGLPLVVACAKEISPSPTAEEPKGEIVVGSLEDLSGPLAGIATEWLHGIKDCVRYINEEKGGVRGHKLRHIIFDYKQEAALAISGWDRMKNENAVVITSIGGQAAPVIENAAREDHIPLFCSASPQVSSPH
jgi:branched-chain amino acid transport system substrate-binding protein